MVQRFIRGIFLLGALLLVGLRLVDAKPARDLGAWRVVVIQSDDWGLEGWFPHPEAAGNLGDLTAGIPARLMPYTQSGLETASEVQRLAELLAKRRDADGLPAVLQANHIVAGPSLRRWPAPDDLLRWPVHPSGEGNGLYRRPELRAAVDGAIGDGVWWPELHGLTHFDLNAYARARETLQPTATRALREGVFAHDGWLRATELADSDPHRARVVAREAYRRFVDRFGRTPDSVIAPDYRWGREDEDAWHELGISVVQAKREQIDAKFRPGTPVGRGLKALARWRDQQGRRFTYLDRPARLEPYGEMDPESAQGALEAADSIREAWKRGEPGILSVHRVQFSNFDPRVARAGRDQLRACLDSLESDGPVRYLVDSEVHQLLGQGWSRLARGPWIIIRNFSPRPVRVEGAKGEREWFDPGTHVLDRPVRSAG